VEPELRLLFTFWLPGPHNYLWIYFTTPFRLDSIALGCLFAILFHGNPYPAMQRVIALTLLIVAGVAVALCSRDPSYFREANAPLFNSIGYSLIALLSGGALLWIVTEPHGLVSRLLSNRVLVWIGTVSYTAYLIHVVVMFAAKHFLGEPRMHQHEVRYRLFTLPITLLIAAFSWYVIERPILTHGRIHASTMPTENMEAT
jgi:peptidoglycan/LPS O-acetylase OafA/YrhL